jgi:AcrR family transcriptional regulator
MIAGAWPTTSMADLARCAGVSRQTLYNDFGSRDGLAQAVAQQTADEFLAGAQAAALGAGDDPVARIAAAAGWAIAAAHENLLVKAALTDDVGGLLPYLTTRSADLLVPIAAEIAQLVDHPQAAWACEVAMRLMVSHLLMPVRSDAEQLRLVSDLIKPLFTEGAEMPLAARGSVGPPSNGPASSTADTTTPRPTDT